MGLKGSNSDFKNRTNSTAVLFTASVAGATIANTQAFNTNNTTPGMPASGLTYTYTPPACYGPPTAGSASNVVATAATLNWVVPVPAPASGFEYEVRTSGTGGSGATGLVASGTTAVTVTTVAVTGLSPTTAYTFYVRGNCGAAGFSSWTASGVFTTPCTVFMPPYTEGFNSTSLPPCWTNSSTSGSTNSNVFWKFGTGFDYGTLYNGRPAGSFAWVDASSPYNAVVILTSPVVDLSSLTLPFVKYDWFKNNPFPVNSANNPLQLEGFNGTSWVGLYSDNSNATQWRTVGIPLPASFNGITNAQFRFKVTKANASSDYDDVLLDSFSVTEMPSCLVPGNSTITNITATAATVTWLPSNGAPSGGYQYEVRTSGTAGSGTTGLALSGATAAGIVTANITGLTLATNYVVYVRGNCGATAGTSVWNGGTSFKTLCNAFTAPFSEGFNVGALPDCWTNTNSTNDTWVDLFWKFGTGYGYGTSSNGRPAGTFAYAKAEYPLPSIPRLTSPVIDLSGLVTPFIKFDWFKNNSSTSSASNTFAVEGFNGTSWVPLFSNNTNSSVWRTVAFSLPAGFTGITNAQFRFAFYKNAFHNPYDHVLIDSFSVTTAPICPEPTFIAFSNAGSSGSISWGAPAATPAGGYQYEVRSSGAAGSGPVGLLASGNTAPNITFATISGISVATTYTVYVRSDCGTNSVLSGWKSKAFTTDCFDQSAPFYEAFSTGALPSCWTNTNITGSSVANLLWKFGTGFDHGTLSNGRPAGSFAFVDADAPQTDTPTLTSPIIGFGGIASPFISFDWFKNNTDPATIRTNNNLLVEGYNGVDWVLLFSDTSNSSVWRTVEIPLPASFSNFGKAQFRFKVGKIVSGSYDDVLLDNFFAGSSPTCGRPANLTVLSVASDKATIGWSPATFGNPSKWQMSYGPAGIDPNSGLRTTVTTNSGVISGLTPGKSYDVYVKALCGPGDNSDWSDAKSFSTSTMGIPNDALAGTLTLFPNPASDFVNIKNTSSQTMERITVLNALGAVVSETRVSNGTQARINTNGLAAGSYLVRIQLDNTTIVRRLQITK